ncbi:N5-carboxyaminoimidazole ribonucleotide mutase [Oenococcus oeni]|uniref:5-(carboxyamino)imidazole ribonucleotide mutase n=1 Tax=Oenococcus oeni TaxID=1247 RepID=UPI000BDF1A87|nr:5-(carboxyamino)imidazole ribonucleotide mutase [Oenococcus oeni]PDH84567.1 N5-carboxyaminoimidazole ribonucleotide mutase [Oenococcus oeni]PDH88023.1 N5-carboxyaminoimidazole ribonucleotide mutase [Oenococcus oeni]PDH89365.1 N5-carboxyaminoimidazole ribonucleotide mutase [Oenococcus oeni]PDH90609.1 N5-carboxyaminoimidazole ribonucleotide mutase [Oenococcus oeni]PDH91089.1 N5-carboxyaminoimidazole ribonucleotide mutase [Oenococcus oeni]
MSNTKIAVVMGSVSDWETMKNAVNILKDFGVEIEKHVISAHRMPDQLSEFSKGARQRGLQMMIAGAGGAAHLPGMLSANTTLPVIGVPIQSHALNGLDSLLSIVQMPAGIPVATTAIGNSGAKNAAYLALSILSLQDQEIENKLIMFRREQTKKSLESDAQLND